MPTASGVLTRTSKCDPEDFVTAKPYQPHPRQDTEGESGRIAGSGIATDQDEHGCNSGLAE